MAKIIQVIETFENRGTGKDKEDVFRQVYQLWTLDGRLIFEKDPFEKV